MSGLKNTLDQWFLPGFSPPSIVPTQIQAARDLVETLVGNVSPRPPSGFDLEQLFHQFRRDLDDNPDMGSFPIRVLNRVPWVLFSMPPENPGILAEHSDVARDYLAWLATRRTGRALGATVYAFLLDYPHNLSTFAQWRRGLEELVQRSEVRSIAGLRHRCDRFRLLDKDGPSLFVKGCLDRKEPLGSTFLEAGLTGQFERRGFSEKVYQALLTATSKSLSSGERDERVVRQLLEFSCESDPHGVRGLKFSDQASKMLDALLLPYAEHTVHGAHKEVIKSFILRHVGDPRIVRRTWLGADDRSQKVMLSWLVEASLELFFDILSKTADNIWAFRRRFWLDYLRLGVIEETWVVLGSQARRYVGSNREDLPFGRLFGASPNQSVLLMRIGGLTIAEWSHSGACRIWTHAPDSDRHAPKLYQDSYTGDGLRTDSDEWVAHRSSDRGGWQKKLGKIIHYQTGIRP